MKYPFLDCACPGVKKLQPYVAGKPVDEVRRELGLNSVVKLASNENPRGPSPAVLEAIAQAAPQVNRYPDGNGYYLKQALAKRHGMSADCITLGNGSNDILELVASVFLGEDSSAVYSEYAFVVYALAVARVGAKAIVVKANNYGHDLLAIADAIKPNTRVVYLANPNNPTGTCFSQGELEKLLQSIPSDIIVVLDEAYYEYVEQSDYPDSVALLSRHPNLVVTRTFSKAYGLSGLRVGFSLSDPAIADLLNRVRQPFNVNSLALVGAQAALEDMAYVEESVALNRAGLRQLVDGCTEFGLSYIPSVANFFCFKPGYDAGQVERALLQKGVILRGVDAYSMPDYLRVSIGLKQENSFFLTQLQSVLTDLGR